MQSAIRSMVQASEGRTSSEDHHGLKQALFRDVKDAGGGYENLCYDDQDGGTECASG